MALHPRLQPPTLETPPKRSNGLVVAMAMTVLAAGFAYAMPKAMTTSASQDPTDAAVLGDDVLNPTGSTHTPTATPSPTPTDGPDEDDGEGKGRADNHGAAVSTAAHCDLDGRAHGEFVRSIARDKDATVAEVEAACEAAKAAAEAAEATNAKVRPARGHGKPAKARFDDDDDAVEVDDDDDEPDPEPAETVPDNGAPADDKGGPPDHAKGDKNKP